MARIASVNLATPMTTRGVTGIDKLPAQEPVWVERPTTLGQPSGLVGDQVVNTRWHGGDEQAVYAYAQEDYLWWEEELGRSLRPGEFGDNLTTSGLGVSGAILGEQWRVGEHLLLEVSFWRVPCATFRERMGVRGWVRRFTEAARPGAYLKVLAPGAVCAGDQVELVHQPAHQVSVREGFQAWLRDPSLLPHLLQVENPALHAKVQRRLSRVRPGVTS